MNVFNIFFPHVTYILGAIICFFIFIFPISLLGGVISVFIFHKASVHRGKKVEPSTILGLSKDHMMKLFSLFFIFVMLVGYTWAFLFFADGWMRAKPARTWENDIKTIDTAIILGFGYEEDETGQMKPGRANEFLLEWTLKHTSAETLLVQEGVWAAVCPGAEKKCEKFGRKFYRIHRDDKKVYVNTLQAVFCALQLMTKLGKTKAVIVAHDLQLERAAWDFEKIKKSQDNWRNFEFIVPPIPDTPFPKNSQQLHTSCSFIYKFVELFLSRARDFLSGVPQQCIASLPGD